MILIRSGFQTVRSVILLMLFLLVGGATVLAQVPANDDPCNATPLTIGTTCVSQPFTNANATGSTGVTAPGCASYLGGDVWFSVVVPAGGTLIFETQAGVMTDGGMAIYRGTCNSLTLIECDDDDGPGLMPLINRTGLTPGETIWIRVWEYGNNNNGTFGICVRTPPAPPANDECANAIALPVEPACTFQTFTNEAATGSTGAPAPGCAGYGGGDVWFTVVVPAGGVVDIRTQAATVLDAGMAVYSGTCGTLTLVQCNDNGAGNGTMPRITLTRTPGETLYVRVWEDGNNNNGTFGICASIPPPPPANDDPCNATVLPVSTGTCNYQTFTNVAATGSTGVPAPGCASYQGGDVWFQVTVPANGALLFETQTATGGFTDGGMAVYRGTCGSLALVECDDDDGPGTMPFISLTSLTPGATLWIRVWEFGGDAPGAFQICVRTPPPPPANDDPCNAVPLTPNSACTFQTFTNESATGSVGVPAPGCGGYSGGDVWFSFQVPAQGVYDVQTQAGVMTDGAMALYTGTCGALTLIDCNDNGTGMPRITRTGTPGQTIWVRMWENGNNNNGTFGICVSIPPPPPANDDPCNAVVLPVAQACTYQTFTNASATGTTGTGIPAPGCAGYTGGDVWFRAVVPASGALAIDMIEGVMTDGGLAIYRGSCTNMALIRCDDNSSANGNMPQIIERGLTPGATIWIRVWENGNNNNGTFGICVTEPPPPSPGSICATALPFCTNTTYIFPNNTNVPSLGGGGIYGCLTTTPNPVWYYMQVQNPGNLVITINQRSCTGAGLDVDYALWGPFASISDACNGLTAGNNISCSYSIAATETATVNNAQTGQIYILLITNFSNQPGIITFSQTAGTGGAGSVDCSNVNPCNLSVSNSGPVCTGDSVTLNASNLSCGVYSWTGPNGFTSNVRNPRILPPTTPGVYDYTVTVSFGAASASVCTATTQVRVNERPSLGRDTSVAVCGVPSINLNSLYNLTNLSAQWTLGGTPVTDPTNVSTPGAYQLIVTNASGCRDTAIATISVGSLPSIGADATRTICAGQPLDLTSIFNTAGLTTVWTTGGVAVPNPSAVTASGTYQVVASNAAGCTDTALVTVTFNPKPDLGTDVSRFFCTGSTFNLNNVFTLTGLTAEWTLNGNSVVNPAAVNTPGIYQVIVTNSFGCRDTALVQLSQNSLSTTVSTQNATCFQNGTITASAVGGLAPYSYALGTATNFGSNATFTVPSPNTAYTVFVRDEQGCVASASATVNFTFDLTLQGRADTSICAGASVNMRTVSNALNFSWSPANTLSSSTIASPVATPTETTVYTLTATAGTCLLNDEVLVVVNPNPVVSAGADVQVVRGDDGQLGGTISGANRFVWSPATYLNSTSILNPMSVRPEQTITYRLTATNELGCSAFDDVQVVVLPYCIKVKNAFTPNGDGVNDNWSVYDQFDCLKNINVQVYNRYGSRVFESRNYRNEWRGTFNGKPLPDGTYYYVVDFQLVTGRTVQVRGDVTILR